MNKVEIKSDWNETNVGNIYVGGIAATQYSGTIDRCYNEGNITGNTKNSDSTVASATYSGGIAGIINGGTTINCYNKGNITAYKLSGNNSNNAGGITAIINNTSSNVESCYNIGTIIGIRGDTNSTYTGGIIGRIQVEGTISNCYYLEGTATGGINGADVEEQAEVKTSDEMRKSDFVTLLNKGENNWKIVKDKNDDYPILSWQN